MRHAWSTVLLSSSLIISAGFGQNPGDQPTAGFTNSRTYLNSDAGNFKPPLELAQTLDLEIGTGADTLSVFEDYLLIGRGGDPSSYRLLDRDTGEEQWVHRKTPPGTTRKGEPKHPHPSDPPNETAVGPATASNKPVS